MLYKKYIENFTVSDETKSALLNTVLQLSSRPQTAEAKYSSTKTVNKSVTNAKPKKQNTFKLHPKRWAIILTSVFVVLALVPILYYTLGRDFIKNVLTMDYITNMMVDVDGVTGYGIKREQTAPSARSNYAYGADNGWRDFLTFGNYAYADEPEYKNYLYKTTATYEVGNVEYGEGTIERVTFKKNNTTTEEVYDENGKLITSATELTQDEISGQVNKIYVGENFTFMQFTIPVAETGPYRYYFDGNKAHDEWVEVRPDALTYDEYGISDFDKSNYYTDHLNQSFVIDNKTGYIYKIEGLKITNIISDEFVVAQVQRTVDYRGLYEYYEYDDTDCYKMSLNDDGTLSFTDVLPNKNVTAYYDWDVCSPKVDKYGWLYLVTDILNSVDEQNKVIFTTIDNKYKYLFSSDNRVFIRDNQYDAQIDYEVIDGVKTPVSDELTAFSLKTYTDDVAIWGYYKGHRMWNNDIHYSEEGQFGFGIDDYISFADDVGDLVWFDETTVVSMKDNVIRYITLDLDACLTSPRLNISLDEFTVVETADETQTEGWTYADSHYVMIGNDKMVVNNVYYKITATGNIYYQLVKEGGELKLNKLSDKSYTTNTFILQPINK